MVVLSLLLMLWLSWLQGEGWPPLLLLIVLLASSSCIQRQMYIHFLAFSWVHSAPTSAVSERLQSCEKQRDRKTNAREKENGRNNNNKTTYNPFVSVCPTLCAFVGLPPVFASLACLLLSRRRRRRLLLFSFLHSSLAAVREGLVARLFASKPAAAAAAVCRPLLMLLLYNALVCPTTTPMALKSAKS